LKLPYKIIKAIKH